MTTKKFIKQIKKNKGHILDIIKAKYCDLVYYREVNSYPYDVKIKLTNQKIEY